MDARYFDALARTLSIPNSRRRLLARLVTLPMLGGLLSLIQADDAGAKDRRRRRKQRHKTRKNPGQKKGCKPKRKAAVCAGQCGAVKNRETCGKTVDCGSCDCGPACGECFTCQGSPGVCVPAAGTPCGTATCDSGTATPRSTCDGTGGCQPADPVSCAPYALCDGNACATNCADDTWCVAGSHCESGECTDDLPNGESCGSDGQCASGHCIDGVCCDTACDGACEVCGLTGTCTACSATHSCPSGEICDEGSCRACDVTCTGTAAQCGTALQTAIMAASAGDTLRVCAGTY